MITVTAPPEAAEVNFVWDSLNAFVPAGASETFGGRTRWFTPANLSIVKADAANPFGLTAGTLRVGTASATGGKYIYTDEAGLKAGDACVVAVLCYAAAATTFRLYCQWQDGAGANVGSAVDGGIVSIDNTTAQATVSLAVPAGAARLLIWIARASGSSNIDCYAVWGAPGANISSVPMAGVNTERWLTALYGATPDNLMWDAFNRFVEIGNDWDRPRWYTAAALSIDTADSGNPYGAPSLVLAAGQTVGGKYVWFRELGVAVGDVLTVRVSYRQASGAARFYAYYIDDGQAQVGSSYNVPARTMDGNIYIDTLSLPAVPSGATGLRIYLYHAADQPALYCHAMWLFRGVVGPAVPVPTVGKDSWLTQMYGLPPQNLVPDPFFQYVALDQSWRGLYRWYLPAQGLLVPNDAGNPFGAPTLRIPTGATTCGKIIYLNEVGLQPGDTVSAAALLNAGSGGVRVYIRFQDTDGVEISSANNGAGVTMGGTAKVVAVRAAVIPAGTKRLVVAPARASGTANIDCYTMWLVKGGYIPLAPHPPALVDSWLADYRRELPAWYGEHLMRQYHAQAAKIKNGLADSRLNVLFLGDSWVNRAAPNQYLRDWLQTLYGNGGYGYVSANQDMNLLTGMTRTHSGTWTHVDFGGVDVAYGPDGSHVFSTDAATPAKVVWTSEAHMLRIHYIARAGGGQFRYRVDVGGWTTVSTAASSTAAAFVEITGLDGASHALTVEIVSAGTNGVILVGAEFLKSGSGAVLHKGGNGGAKGYDFLAMDATIWQAQVEALSPDLAIIMLGTNDSNAIEYPRTWVTHLTDLIGRIRAVRPLCDVLLIFSADNGLVESGTTPVLMQAFEGAMRRVAHEQGAGFLSFYMLLGPYEQGNARGLYSNTSHVNNEGSRILIDNVSRHFCT